MQNFLQQNGPTVTATPHVKPVLQGDSGTRSQSSSDEHSAVQRVEYSLDASRWRLVYPKDGIPDSRREEFEVTLDDSEAARSVIIRAMDGMNNVATAVAEVKK